MDKPEADIWPLPKFNAGDGKALHAVGVISLTFVQFERGVDNLFLHHPAHGQISRDLLHHYFYSLNEQQRPSVTRKFYREQEADPLVVKATENVLEFFDWAHDARNKILHSELYPAAFGGRHDTFYLTKRAGKRDSGSIYLAFKVHELRDVAEKMRAGVVAAAEINIHVRYRDVDPLKIERSLRVYAVKPPSFTLLPIPGKIKATETP
ncbi:hypothetical protein AYJ54_39890 [Bradyrhizobium centrolobii]|uniref:Uncharacterized protein n=1 Tax=Bradyrhizobium centrolobii TaxID=1505087 RepID=A0A176Z493_9BRAD|nr:hypothetical protein [Bradyrhizobium centrolobii]OAF15529.1 hypothetical protein AYJ54_39890 [Bradyrhizobium centrolobii]